MEYAKFEGTIDKVTRDGRSALVKLDHEVEGRSYAVISPTTDGRVVLMNGKGELEPKTFVRGKGLLGPETVLATSVRAG